MGAAGALCSGTRARHERVLVLAPHGDCTVARHVVRPIDIFNAERLADQQGTKAGAIEEKKVAADLLAVLEVTPH